jgi:PAS domain S-box-containing protein
MPPYPGALAALAHEEERYRMMVGALSEGVVIQDASGAILTCNSSAERILGLTRDQMLGRTSVDPRWHAAHEDGSPFPGETHPAMVSLRSGLPLFDVIMGIHRPDGAVNWISVTTQPLIEPGSSKAFAVVSSFYDITERRRAYQALRAANAEIEDLYQNAPCGYHSLDKDGVVIRINDTGLAMIGYTRAEVLNRMRYADLFTPESRARYDKLFAQFKERGSLRDVELDLVRKDLTVMPILVSATAIRDASGRFIASRSVVVDMTRTRNSTQALRDKNEALEARVVRLTAQLESARAELELLRSERQGA